MASAATVDQLELIKDDPRKEASDLGPLALYREYKKARAQYGDLITRPLAAEILGVSSNQVGVWCDRGRITAVNIGPTKFVPGSEIEALYRQRSDDGLPKGGAGRTAIPMSEIVRLGSNLTDK